MQMKELVLALVEEGLVEQDRCGTTNLYWSFPYLQHKSSKQTISFEPWTIALLFRNWKE